MKPPQCKDECWGKNIAGDPFWCPHSKPSPYWWRGSGYIRICERTGKKVVHNKRYDVEEVITLLGDERKILEILTDEAWTRANIPIHELIRTSNIPIERFCKAFINLHEKRKIHFARSNFMKFWKVSDEDWNRKDPSGDKYWAYRHGIKEFDRQNMIQLAEAFEKELDWDEFDFYWVWTTHPLAKL